ncbi:transcription factor MYB23-like protein [Corchorus olitorius]|uniref:Transcription factor MYB23-like protein n=1 Tax=Corchorus olitorius TaxID=93759 RepID=A0A1R3I5I2_9ROSI|nr:transcription factor MYB23-like protein [Corchorus olitorius]
MAMQIPNSESRTHQIDPNKEFPYLTSIDSSTINMSSSSSSSIHHLSEFNYNLLDDQNPCINWDANVVVNETTFEAPRVEGIQHQQEKEKICDMEINKIVQVDNMDMVDAAPSFDSCSFDLSLLESTLMSSAICRDFNSMDEFAWNF